MECAFSILNFLSLGANLPLAHPLFRWLRQSNCACSGGYMDFSSTLLDVVRCSRQVIIKLSHDRGDMSDDERH